MPIYRGAWLLPIAGPPVRGGWVAADHGRITATGTGPVAGGIDLGDVAILPGLVNAHTHLELSCLAGRVPPARSFTAWVRTLLAMRREAGDPAAPAVLDAARDAIAAARAAGTALVGDISNTLTTVPLLREAGMPAHVFYELLGFAETDPARRVADAAARLEAVGRATGEVRVSLAPHAPYSVAPGLLQAIAAELDRDGAVTSVHLAESPEEVELVRDGTGGWRDLLHELGAWRADWTPYGGTPVAYLGALGVLRAQLLAVHGVQCTTDDLALLARAGATLVSCPRSNRWVGVGAPPLEACYAAGVAVAFGTDSLASVDDLNLFAELAEARRIAPRVPAARLLESATRVGARALDRGGEFGTLEPGRRSALLAVRLPGPVADVEEYLLTGIQPEAVRWLDA